MGMRMRMMMMMMMMLMMIMMMIMMLMLMLLLMMMMMMVMLMPMIMMMILTSNFRQMVCILGYEIFLKEFSQNENDSSLQITLKMTMTSKRDVLLSICDHYQPQRPCKWLSYYTLFCQNFDRKYLVRNHGFVFPSIICNLNIQNLDQLRKFGIQKSFFQ